MDKFSEKNIRQEKVDILKDKIKKEIYDKIKILEKDFLDLTHDDLTEDEKLNKDITINYLFYLSRLSEFIDKKQTFMEIVKCDVEDDFVIYVIENKYIDMFLEDGFNFVNHFLCNIDVDTDFQATNIYKYLSDTYFACSFISVIEDCLYNKKI